MALNLITTFFSADFTLKEEVYRDRKIGRVLVKCMEEVGDSWNLVTEMGASTLDEGQDKAEDFVEKWK